MNASRTARRYFWIVIVSAGDEPMAVEANDSGAVARILGQSSIALCAPTTHAALLRAGWTDDSITREGEPAMAFEVAS